MNLKNRLREPSTWAGLSALLLANAMVMGQDWQAILGGLAMLTGSVAILLREGA